MEKIVSKKLQKTDIEKRLTIPSKSLNHFPSLSGNHMVDFQAGDESGQVWKFRIYTRKKKYLKPVLTKGWREFVCCKELRTGDSVAFYMKKEQAGVVKYRVDVEKQAQKFGTSFPQKPMHSDTNPVQNQEIILSTRDQVGDGVVFYKKNEQASAFEMEKQVKIFGAVFALKPIHSDMNPVQNQETILSTIDQGRPKRSSKEHRVVFCKENEPASSVTCRVEVEKAVKIFGVDLSS